MKVLLGILTLLVVLSLGIIGILAIWGIYPVSWETVSKSGITLIIVSATVAILYLVVTLFFKKEKYDREEGNRAHRMN